MPEKKILLANLAGWRVYTESEACRKLQRMLQPYEDAYRLMVEKFLDTGQEGELIQLPHGLAIVMLSPETQLRTPFNSVDDLSEGLGKVNPSEL